MNYSEISSMALTQLLKSENERYQHALNDNLSFDQLKTIRLNIRVIEQVIQSRQERPE